MLHSLFCLAPLWIKGPNTAAGCAEACAQHIKCAGYYSADNASCYFCGPGSQWGSYDGDRVQTGARSVEWTTPRGCSTAKTCVACPGDPSVMQTFADYKSSHATLYLSSSCFYADENAFNIEFKTENASGIIELYENSSIIGPGILSNTVQVVGPGVLLQNIKVSSAVELKAERATLDTVTSDVALCACIAVGTSVDGTEITASRGTECGFAGSHISGFVSMQKCPLGVPAYVLQERENDKDRLFVGTDSMCDAAGNVNLTKLLDAFGTEYEIRFFNSGQYGYADKAAKRFLSYSIAFFSASIVAYVIATPNLF